jgi:cytochrome c oxidase subunit 2
VDGALGTEDDICARHHVHLPKNTKVRLQLTSDDYLYTLTLPEWDLKEMAVPDMVFTLEFETKQIGQYDLLGDQMCGYAHEELLGRLVVQSHEDFNSWLHDRQRAAHERGDSEHEP